MRVSTDESILFLERCFTTSIGFDTKGQKSCYNYSRELLSEKHFKKKQRTRLKGKQEQSCSFICYHFYKEEPDLSSFISGLAAFRFAETCSKIIERNQCGPFYHGEMNDVLP
jgi:hypothetical protein